MSYTDQQLYELAKELLGSEIERRVGDIHLYQTGGPEDLADDRIRVDHLEVGSFEVSWAEGHEEWNDDLAEWVWERGDTYHFEGWYHDDYPAVTQEEAGQLLTAALNK